MAARFLLAAGWRPPGFPSGSASVSFASSGSFCCCSSSRWRATTTLFRRRRESCRFASSVVARRTLSVYLLCLLLMLRVRVLLVLSGDGDGFCFLFLFFCAEAKEQIFSLSLRVDVARDGTPTNPLRFTFLREREKHRNRENSATGRMCRGANAFGTRRKVVYEK